VSEADSILFGRTELVQAFTALGERLVRRGVVADIFIVGGAAMALAYDAARVTRDVDAMFKPHGIVHEEAMQVARTPDESNLHCASVRCDMLRIVRLQSHKPRRLDRHNRRHQWSMTRLGTSS
jgi:hypothetical protein